MSGAAADERYEPNLTPILDMVFQLITFFMLVTSFKAASLDVSLKLPVIGSAQPVDTTGMGDLLVLNVDSEGALRVFGEKRQDVEQYIASEAQSALNRAKSTAPQLKAGDDLPNTIVVRADRATPFHMLNRVVRACQANGFRKFHYRVANSEQET
ncbi:MAG: biopolymer transporter ExbD [Pirellulales bacterium]|nr:biopolymer transporter ExbD [Pirellulales bacterium]